MCHWWQDSSRESDWPIHMSAMTHTCVENDSFICVTWLIYICDMTHSYVWYDYVISGTWTELRNRLVRGSFHRGPDSFIYGTWLIYIWDMTHPHVCDISQWHDSFISETRYDVSLATGSFHRWHDSSVCETWLVHMCVTFCSDMTHS